MPRASGATPYADMSTMDAATSQDVSAFFFTRRARRPHRARISRRLYCSGSGSPVPASVSSTAVKARMGVPKSAVVLQRGGQSRTKILVIEGLSDPELKARLTDL